MEPFATRRSNYAFLLLIFITLAIIATVFLVRQTQELRKKAQVTTEVHLAMYPPIVRVNQSEEFEVSISMDTGTVYHVSSAKLVIKYDPVALQGVSITAGTFLTEVLGSPGSFDEINGIAKIQVGIADISGQGVQGDGEIAKIRFKAVGPVDHATLTFVFDGVNDSSGVAAFEADLSVLLPENAFGGTVTVIGPSPSPSPTPTMSPGPSVTPAPTPTPDATPSTSPVASPIADTRLILVPSLNTVKPGDDFDVSLNMYTGENSVSAADIRVNFDNTYVDLVSVTLGNFLPTVLAPAKFSDKQMTVTLASIVNAPKKGDGVLLTIRVHAKKAGVTNLIVDPASSVSAVDASNSAINAVIERGNSLINISSGIGGQVISSPPTFGGGMCTKTAPGAPTGLVAYAGDTYYDVDLFWNPVAGATHYGIVYGRQSGKYIYGAVNVGNVSTYKVRQLAPGTRYYFAVFAVNDCISSGFSNPATVITNAPAGSGGTGTVLPTPTPAPEFTPIDPNIPPAEVIPFLTETRPSVVPIASPLLPSPSASPKPSVNPIVTPLGGILLIIAAIFAGLLFLKLREER